MAVDAKLSSCATPRRLAPRAPRRPRGAHTRTVLVPEFACDPKREISDQSARQGAKVQRFSTPCGPFACLYARAVPTLRLLCPRSHRTTANWAKTVVLADGIDPCCTPIAIRQPGAKSPSSHQLTWGV